VGVYDVFLLQIYVRFPIKESENEKLTSWQESVSLIGEPTVLKQNTSARSSENLSEEPIVTWLSDYRRDMDW
jgi:hypothetical protein